MKSLIFVTGIRILTPVFLVFSLYILMRGHNHPGGGFIGGLIGAIAFVFHTLAYGESGTTRSYFSFAFYKYARKPNHGNLQHTFRLIRKNISKSHLREEPKSISNYYLFKIRPTYFMATGLLIALMSGTVGLLHGKPFMTGFWLNVKMPLVGSIGTPLLFDFGVYLLVMGMILKMVFTMSKD